MTAQLTDETIRSLSSSQSYTRGRDLYRGGAIFDAARQGDLLLGKCRGSGQPFYTLRVEIDAAGVRSAECSCPYDWGGICKHLVAFLLAFVHSPEVFSQRRNVPDLLADLDRHALLALLSRLVEVDPELYDSLEAAATTAHAAANTRGAAAHPRGRALAPEPEQVYRRQVKNILRSLDGSRSSPSYWMITSVVDRLRQVRDAAFQLLEAGDAQGALTILLVLLEEIARFYQDFDDSDGELAVFLGELGQNLAETILSQDLSGAERSALEERLVPILDELAGYGVEEVDIAVQALEEGWSALSLEDDSGQADWLGSLTHVKLNVLERQGRVDEYLDLCQAAGEHLRCAVKLLDLGKADEAARVAVDHLQDARQALEIARRLQALGDLDAALAVGERGLSLEGPTDILGAWLGPLEEAQGRTQAALLAYRLAFDGLPSLELYQTLQRLAGRGWQALRPELISTLDGPWHNSVLVEIFLHEHEWDAAIRLVDAHAMDTTLAEAVADAVLPHRPEWVIRVSQAQAEQLIATTQSNRYPAAGAWLERAKQAYIRLDRQAEWRAYLAALKQAYSRRPALQEVLRRL